MAVKVTQDARPRRGEDTDETVGLSAAADIACASRPVASPALALPRALVRGPGGALERAELRRRKHTFDDGHRSKSSARPRRQRERRDDLARKARGEGRRIGG